MALTAVELPPVVSLAGNPIWVIYSTDNHAEDFIGIHLDPEVKLEDVWESASSEMRYEPNADHQAIVDFSKILQWDPIKEFTFPERVWSLIVKRNNLRRQWRLFRSEKYGNPLVEYGDGYASGDRYILPGAVSALKNGEYNEKAINWHTKLQAKKFFLSNSPRIKVTDSYSPERLYFFVFMEDVTSIYMRIKVYYTDGTSVTTSRGIASSVSQYDIYELITSYSRLGLSAIDTEKTISKYEIWINNQDDEVISEVYTYLLDSVEKIDSRYFIFRNSYKMYECVRFYGNSIEEISIESMISSRILEKDYTSSDRISIKNIIDESHRVKANSGWLTSDEISWLRDFIGSTDVYEIIDEKIYPVEILDNNYLINAKKSNLKSLAVEYKYDLNGAKDLEIDAEAEEFSIVDSFAPALIRNNELNNVVGSANTNLITVTAVSGNTITVNYLPESALKKGVDWFAMSTSDFNVSGIGYTGDYTVQSKVVSFIASAKQIELVDATGFTIGDTIALYSHYVNYSFLPGQESSGIIRSSGSVAWRDFYASAGPVWYDDDNDRYVLLVNAQGDKYQIGFATCDDIEANVWTMGNSDAPIILNSDDPNYVNGVLASGNAIDIGNGRVAFAIWGRDAANFNHIFVVQMDKDCSNITISSSLLGSVNSYPGASLEFYKGKYTLSITNSSSGSIPTWTNEMWQSDTIDSGYTKKCDILTSEYDDNDSVWVEGHVDGSAIFQEKGKLYALLLGTQRYTASAIRGNRVCGLMRYDNDSNSWSIVNDFAPELIFPMYFYNIPSEDYGWAGGRFGGYPSFIKRNSNCYLFLSGAQYADSYMVAALKMISNV